MIYFHLTEILISVFTTKQNVVFQKYRVSDNFLDKLLSLKIGIVVRGGSQLSGSYRNNTYHLKQNDVFW